jgi:hypothetical protein
MTAVLHLQRDIILRGVPISRVGVKVENLIHLGGPRAARVARLPAELARALPTMDGAPLLLDHDDNGRTVVVGAMRRPRFDGLDIIADVEVHDWCADMIARGVLPRELSLGWRYVVERRPGAFGMDEYAARRMRCLHLAIVREGWAGPDYALPLGRR